MVFHADRKVHAVGWIVRRCGQRVSLSVAMKKYPLVAKWRYPWWPDKSIHPCSSCRQELRAPMVTVKAPTNRHHHRGVPLKSAKDRMDIISAYQQLGSYGPPPMRAAPLTGPSEGRGQVRSRPGRGRAATARQNGPTTTTRWPSWLPNASRSLRLGSRPSGCCRSLALQGTRGLGVTCGVWSPRRKRCGAALLMGDDCRCGHRHSGGHTAPQPRKVRPARRLCGGAEGNTSLQYHDRWFCPMSERLTNTYSSARFAARRAGRYARRMLGDEQADLADAKQAHAFLVFLEMERRELVAEHANLTRMGDTRRSILRLEGDIRHIDRMVDAWSAAFRTVKDAELSSSVFAWRSTNRGMKSRTGRPSNRAYCSLTILETCVGSTSA